MYTGGRSLWELGAEATRDGAPAIDLIDGEALVGLLKSFGLGVIVEQVVSEKITIDEAFLQEL
jgi:restriction system protein